MKKEFIFFIFLAALVPSCDTSRQTTTLNLPQVKLDDYIFETTPNDLDNVGYVFAVTKEKMQIPLTLLNLNSRVGLVAVESKSRSKNVSFGAVLKFLGMSNFDIPSTAGISKTTKIKLTFTLSNPKISQAFLTSIDSALENGKEAIKKAIINQHIEDAELYIVFQTIRSNKLVYEFDKSSLGNVNLDMVFKPIGSMNDSIQWDNSRGGKLNYDLKSDLNVFYKVLKIDVLSGINGEKFMRGDEVKEQELLYDSSKVQ